MSGFLRGIARIRSVPALRGSTITQRANIASRPAKDALGPVLDSMLMIFSIFSVGLVLILLALTSLLTQQKWLSRRAETIVGLAVFSFTILGPAGWVLANLENYKNKDSASE